MGYSNVKKRAPELLRKPQFYKMVYIPNNFSHAKYTVM